ALGERLLAVLGLADLKVEPFEYPPRHLADDARVVNNQTRLHIDSPGYSASPSRRRDSPTLRRSDRLRRRANRHSFPAPGRRRGRPGAARRADAPRPTPAPDGRRG